MATQEILSTTSEAAFLVDAECKVTGWNRGAEDLLGYSGSEVVGKACWEILAGVDVFGNSFCSRRCPLRQMVRDRKAIHPFDLLVRDGLGRSRRVRVSTLVLNPGHPRLTELMHMLDPLLPATRERVSDEAVRARPERNDALTEREAEVLGLLQSGKGTSAISRALGISRATVRNHIGHVLRKLEAHSRLEAVAKARSLGLLEP